MRSKRGNLSLLMAAALVGLTACAPGQTPGAGARPEAGAPAPVFKSIRVAIGQEPHGWDNRVTRTTASPSAGGIGNMLFMAQDGLRRAGTGGTYVNLLAADVPEAAKGTWVVSPSGNMAMTWKIVPNARWHDGAPVTSADFEFAVRVRNDPEAAGLPSGAGVEKLLTSITVIDDYSFVANWSLVNVTVNDGVGLVPLPKHLLNDLYMKTPSTLGEQRFFTTEYVGTGPFRLVNWERGSHLEFQRFDDYYKGPAKLNRVFLQIIPDPNTMVANILAGAVDVLAPPNVDIAVGLEVKDRWAKEGSKHQVIVAARDGSETWEIMLNPQYARPVNGMTQQPVRRALLQAVDRHELMNVMTAGLSQVAYTFYHEDNENYPYVADLMPPKNPTYELPYDVRQAQQLLTQAGWEKGPDGILVHQPTAAMTRSIVGSYNVAIPAVGQERFDWQIMTRRGDGPFKQASIVQDYWKAVGANLNIEVLTPANQDNNEYLATRGGGSLHTSGGSSVIGRRAHSGNIPSPEIRWTGNNRGHYSNPVVDSLVEKIEVTIDSTQAKALHRQLLAEQMFDLHSYWWYWVTVPILVLEGITGPRLVSQTIMNNIWEWDRS